MTSPALAAAIDAPTMRAASAGALSLALMDARNHTLQLLARIEDALGPSMQPPEGAGVLPPLWVAGHIGWLAEYWISRNPKRGLGAACPAHSVRLASIDPMADHCFNPLIALRSERQRLALPPVGSVKAYLLETLETTLELLENAGDGDDGLYFFRMALFHEDWRGESLAELAQTLGIALPLALPAGTAPRDALRVPAARFVLGWKGSGFALGIEQGVETVDVPEFEIDASPVTWAQYVEFIDDGGYDRQELWHPGGWAWLESQALLDGRRGPRHVEQIGVASGAVMQSFFGKPARMGASQNAQHVSWWEADAYARWAGRRLPAEVEWELAAEAAARRGFHWGQVREWTAGTIRLLPGAAVDAWSAHAELDPTPVIGQARVLRGASFATRARMKHPKARRWALPDDDEGFVGFRTCAP